MAIEIPNILHAAGLLIPLPDEGVDPIFAVRGLLAFDPGTTFDPETFTGGFTRFGTGVYAVKFEEGIDLTEGVCWANTLGLFGSMAIAPGLPEFLGASLGDGRSAQLVFEDSDNKPTDAFSGVQFAVTRFSSSPTVVPPELL